MSKRKRTIWYTDYSVEQCKEIFREKIPAVYTTSFRQKEKFITGNIQDNGEFFLTEAKRSNIKDLEMCGNLKESDGVGTEITLKYKYSLRRKVFDIIFWCIIAFYVALSILRVLRVINIVKENDVISIFQIFGSIFFLWLFSVEWNQTFRLLNQVKTMFNCERKKI